MIDRIVTLFDAQGSEVLRQPARDVSADDLKTTALDIIQRLQRAMKKARGIGLAAPQLGISLRIAVIDASASPDQRTPLALINPVVTPVGSQLVDFEEGCLSIPKVFGMVERPETIRVQTETLQGTTITFQADGLQARVIQHEVDHLAGILFIDRCDRYTAGQQLLPK